MQDIHFFIVTYYVFLISFFLWTLFGRRAQFMSTHSSFSLNTISVVFLMSLNLFPQSPQSPTIVVSYLYSSISLFNTPHIIGASLYYTPSPAPLIVTIYLPIPHLMHLFYLYVSSRFTNALQAVDCRLVEPTPYYRDRKSVV